MTTQQPEALRLAELLELAPEDGIEPQTAEDAAAGLRRLHSENETLQAGYAAARLEIESLQARIKTMAEEHADELMVAHLDGRMCGHSTEPAGAQQPAPPTAQAEGWTKLPGTLPKPGTPVLLDIGMEYPIRAMWAAKHALEVGMEDDSGFGEYDEATDTYYCPEGWYEWNEHEETHWAVDETPTAWCELPPNGGASHGQAPAQAAPAAVAVPSDTFRGDTTCLVQSIIALLELDAEGALVPHGIGGHARALLSAAASRLAAAPTTQPAPTTPQADSQPAPDEIINMAREQGLPETEIEGVFRVNADDLCRVAAAILAARAPADSVLEDAARYRWLRRKFCLTGNGDGTCCMHAINLPASIKGWPEPIAAEVMNFCDAAIDAARKQGVNHD